MYVKWLILIALTYGISLQGALQESAALQELRLLVDQLGYQLNSHTVELTLFQERTLNLEQTLSTFKQSLHTTTLQKSLEKQITALEKVQESLLSDLKLLKGHINQTNTTVATLQTQLNKIDKQLSGDIHSLKQSIQSMLSFLQGEPKSYTVKPGDSLSQIALDHKVDLKALKELNRLTSDTIFSGQQLTLP